MPANLTEIGERLFRHVMAPLVLGGPLRPGHAIGARVGLSLGHGDRPLVDRDLESRVQVGRVRRARHLAPVDTVGAMTPAEWALGAMFHDLLQVSNPTFDAALRRSSAARILEIAEEGIERVPAPVNVRDALGRHTFFARALEVTRTDTAVSWWVGSRTYLGVDPPARLQLWPDLRRVTVVATPHPLLELGPLAIDRSRLVDVVARWLGRTPLTDLATCARAAPAFVWTEASIALAATHAGRTLALRALARLPAMDVDAALGRATRDLLTSRPAAALPVVGLLADRALAEAAGHVDAAGGGAAVTRPEVAFARGLGAVEALRRLASRAGDVLQEEDRRTMTVLEEEARSPAAEQAVSMLRRGLPAEAGHELK
jgi:hypothetical protein